MSAYGRARAWLRAVVLRRAMERDMRDEMNAHIEQATERFMARGMSVSETRPPLTGTKAAPPSPGAAARKHWSKPSAER